tara:strand:+ start:959 stop:1837 length:879 start_codon:yes stop_codon:yes gene_type:complete
MAVQSSTTGQLENASKEMISTARYTEEHNAPMVQLVERFKLERGSDTLVIPKVGQMSMSSLNEGQDIISEEDIGMTTISVTPGEVGAKVIVTDKLLRQNTQNIFGIVGRQLGDGMARRKDEDLVGLFSALNSGTDLSATTRVLSASNATAIIGVAKADKYGTDLRAVFHPNSILRLSRDLSVVGLAQTNQYPIPNGFSASRLQKFWTGVRLGGVPFFETGNITIDANSDGQGAIFNRSALGMLESVSMSRERERDASLRAWEIVMVADYAAFEIDDTKGAPVLVAAGNPATT